MKSPASRGWQAEAKAMDAIEQILDLARWAPSGDNTQPWRFERAGPDHVVIHGFDTRDHVVYDLDGHPSEMAHGALLETLRIAATAHGLRADWTRRAQSSARPILYDVRLTRDSELQPDPLLPAITTRTVQRRPMSTRPLTAAEKADLVTAARPFEVIWFEGWSERKRVALLNFSNAKLRLSIPEAYKVHSSVIDWSVEFSEDRMPGKAIGVDPLTGHIMRWAMASWERVDFMNRYFAGTLAPRLQLDLIPGLACAAHACLLAPKALADTDDYVAAGVAMQRFWLTAERLQLRLQPEMTPLIFSRYVREKRRFTAKAGMESLIRHVTDSSEQLIGAARLPNAAFLCRLGAGPPAISRSVRLPLDSLWVKRA
ncbi:MAG: nitroreductase family protein [Rhodocyclaceae bacterium]|nr:nitroreductase family protein [Rhodocyclaceae bacterium]